MPMIPDFRLEVHFAKWEFVAQHNMTASDMESMRVADLLALADGGDRDAWEALRLGYTESRGAPSLREAIAATYDTLSESDILCFMGAEEGLFCAMHALLEAGDHAIVTVPNYQATETVPRSICDVTGLMLRPEAGWALDVDELRAALRPNTKLVAINFPNNPTGAIAERAVFEAIIALCAERGIFLLSDEVYRGLERDPGRALPQAADLDGRALSLNVMSKAYGMPGLRLGWIASRDHATLSRMERIKHYLSVCNAGPSEVLAQIALRNRGAILKRNRDLCRANLAKLDAFFADHGDLYEWEAPPGGCVGYPRYRGADGVEAHCRHLVEEAGVLLLPASIFASDLLAAPADRFRVGFGRADLDAGLDAWRRHLEGRR